MSLALQECGMSVRWLKFSDREGLEELVSLSEIKNSEEEVQRWFSGLMEVLLSAQLQILSLWSNISNVPEKELTIR
ncbi:2475_t:CDS:2, partial [Gigaspora rosea]